MIRAAAPGMIRVAFRCFQGASSEFACDCHCPKILPLNFDNLSHKLHEGPTIRFAEVSVGMGGEVSNQGAIEQRESGLVQYLSCTILRAGMVKVNRNTMCATGDSNSLSPSKRRRQNTAAR